MHFDKLNEFSDGILGLTYACETSFLLHNAGFISRCRNYFVLARPQKLFSRFQ